MKIISVNVGTPREAGYKGMTVQTAIFKSPVDGPVMIRELNLDGDRQADLTVHGGPDKAVYGYPAEHYDFWRDELPHATLSWGEFGENLTTRGFFEETLYIGDRVKIGDAILQVTQPRMPCYKLALKFERDDMIKRFLASGRSGFYFSVEKPGKVHAGANAKILSRDPNQVTVADINRLYFGKTLDYELLQRAIKVTALPASWKDEFRQKANSHRR